MSAVPDANAVFPQKLRNAWDAATFVKLTLSAPVDTESLGGLRNLKARPVELKDGRRLSLVECFPTRELTRNYPPQAGVDVLADAFATNFSRAHLFTTTGDFQFRRELSGKVTVKASRPAFSQTLSLEHDRQKPDRAALASSPFLQRLGVTNAEGAPRPGMAGKLRQVQRFVEILGHLLDDWGWDGSRPLKVADMGAGKGYLTFALAHALRTRGWEAHVIGVELRTDLVDSANTAARELGFDSLEFVAGSIGHWQPDGPLDVLVALHACNTATDDALFQGIKSGAGLLLSSPCCHQELRPQLGLPPALACLSRHGILQERQAEIVTDALRAHLLELRGYDARVFEFVEPEHSGKNLMLAGVRRQSGPRVPAVIREELGEMWRAFGLRTQRLAELLEEVPQ